MTRLPYLLITVEFQKDIALLDICGFVLHFPTEVGNSQLFFGNCFFPHLFFIKKISSF